MFKSAEERQEGKTIMAEKTADELVNEIHERVHALGGNYVLMLGSRCDDDSEAEATYVRVSALHSEVVHLVQTLFEHHPAILAGYLANHL